MRGGSDPRTRKRWLLDASPDLPEQLELARRHGALAPDAPGRPALFDGIFLTHAHTGHYTGLIHLGRETYGSATQAVHGSQRMVDYLGSNGPWELMSRLGQIELVTLTPGEPVVLTPELSVVPILVPHRPEYSDTFAYLVRGPTRSLLYLPDIDKWEQWQRPVEELVGEVDVALLDGTFHGPDEVPGRDMADIPHPFLLESIARFAPLPESERAKIRFFHLNHSNPAADPRSAAAAEVRAAGMSIARDGDRFGL